MPMKTAQTQGFLVPADADGLEIGERNKLMGINALPTFTVTLDRLPDSGRQ